MPSITSQEIHLKRRPVGMPAADDFEVATVSLEPLGSDEVLVRNEYMSVDPYMRGRMVDRKSYVPPFQIGEPLQGGCVGQIVESNNQNFQVGEYVLGFSGWREYFISKGKELHKVDPNIAPLQSFLGVVGMPGQTAYFGLLDIGDPKPGETVFVSAASGAVGSVVCQIAKLKGCRVIGSAGSEAKVQWLKDEAGIDAAINYKSEENLTKALSALAPDGIDVYFENVGGAHMEAALNVMNNYGRIPLCGMISIYNATSATPGPSNFAAVIGKRIKIQGFIVSDYAARMAEFYADMGPWVAEGKVKYRETIFNGIEQAPEAFISLFTGEKMGKTLVKV